MSFGKFLNRAFGLGGRADELERLFAVRQAEADAANARAEAAARTAQDMLRASMVDPLDSEEARRKSERKQRSLLAAQQPDLGDLGAAPVGYKLLMGQ